MRFDEFINYIKKTGGVDTDGYYGKQCMDLINFYLVNVCGLQKGRTGADCAKNLLNNSYVMQNVVRIDNYLKFVPKKGDIAVGNLGQYGHTCICTGEGNINYFMSYDQNWRAQTLTLEKHNYLDMGKLVFLRPKNQENIEFSSNKYDIGSYEVTSVSGLNVRQQPNINSKKITSIGYKSKQGIDRVQGNWGHLMNNVGWICLDYCKKI